MHQDVLQMLQRCYENSREPVVLLDEEWNVVWSSQNLRVGYLPAMLGVPEDSWESCIRTLRLGDRCYECSLVCNAQDGIRIAVLHQPGNDSIPMESDIISNAISSVNAACAELHRRYPDGAKELNTITGNCYKIYRTTYLQKELDRRTAGFWQKGIFPVKSALAELGACIEDVLGTTTDIELSVCEEKMYLEADKDAFAAALLSAVVLCYDEDFKEKRHELDIDLQKAGDKLLFEISMKPTPEDRDDRKEQLSSFGSVTGEAMLLDAFCKEYGGRWLQSRTGNRTACRIELPAADPSKILTLNSPVERSEGRFFNKYEILLARILFRGFF